MMNDWQNLIQKMSKFGRLSESSKVAKDAVAAMSPKMRREALEHFVQAYVEEQIRAHTRSVEVAAQLSQARSQAEEYRKKLSERHGVPFSSLEEANRYDDQVTERRIREKKELEEKRRREIAASLLEDLHIQWSSELLGAGFKLGDGSSTTWGEATIQQHESRITMMMKNITGNVDTMKRHEAAVMVLTSSGAPCLNEAESIMVGS